MILATFGYGQILDSITIPGQLIWEPPSSGSHLTLEPPFDFTIPSGNMDRMEIVNDTLYVYKYLYPNPNSSCAVYHPSGDKCSWNEPIETREVYAIRLVKTQIKKSKTVTKKVDELIEYWE